MTPEEKSLLERTYELAKENNALLVSIRSTGRWSIALKIGYWVVILALTYGAFYFIQPALGSLIEAYGGGSGDGSGSVSALQDLLK